MTDGRARVKLGDHDYVVVPQRHAYLANQLGEELVEVLQGVQEEAAGKQLGRQAYLLLQKLLPGDDGAPSPIMSEHEFMGYPTAEAYEAGEYDPAYDKSPTVDEIFTALKMVARVNLGEGYDALKALGGTLSPAVKEAMGNYLVSELSSRLPRSSPQANGASAPTPSGTSVQTAA